MKTRTLVFGLLLIPSVSFAAPLTNDQATSLIAVVQSSTTTPASAFVPLITTFSNITVNQATTLIEVVQASPNTPANAFVNMLIAFTIDPIFAGVVEQAPPPSPNPVPTPIPTPTPIPEPVVAVEPTPVIPDTEIIKNVYDGYYKFRNNKSTLGITYSTAVIKVWRNYTGNSPKEVSVEVYAEWGLVSKAGYWSEKGHLAAGEFPFVSESTIGDSEETALTVEVPVNLHLPKKEHDIRIEVHPDNANLSNSSSYRGVLVELR